MYQFFTHFIKPSLLVLTIVLTVIPAYAQEASQKELLGRINTAKNELLATENRISQQSRDYAQKLQRKEQEIKNLRTQAAAQQRLADEQLLGLDKLKERVDQWATQSNYQQHVLAHYRDSMGLNTNIPLEQTETLDGASTLAAAYAHLETSLNPRWHERQVISIDGRVIQAQVLALGPVTLALDAQTQRTGLLRDERAAEAQVIYVFDRHLQSGLSELHNQGQGQIAFDPTLGNALQLLHQGESLLAHLKKGGAWAIPILFFGFLSFLVSVLKSIQLARLPRINTELAEHLQQAVQENTSGDTSELKQKIKSLMGNSSPAQQKLTQLALTHPVSQQRDDLLVAHLMDHKHTLEKYMGVVATSAAIAPLLGLLGTVSGMITTFKMMTIFGSGDVSTVSAGISEALITTELGLIVAIPSLIVSALMSRHLRSYIHKLENFAIKLSKIRFKA